MAPSDEDPLPQPPPAAGSLESPPTAAENASSSLEAAKNGAGGGDAACSSRSQSENEILQIVDDFFEKGSTAIEDEDFVTAVDCLSRSLEIRVAHFGELAPECATAYYKYGCALLYKAQEETDPLGNISKDRTDSAASANVGLKYQEGRSGGSVISHKKQDDAGSNIVEDGKEETAGEDPEDREGDSDEEDDVAEADEDDETDLDLAWKMLDIARAILEKCSGDTMEKVKVFSALAEVSMEREDFETSLADYQRALSIVEKLVEPDHRRIIELNFRLCLVLEVGSKIEEAVPYCEKAISLCKTRLQNLKQELLKIQSSASLPDSGSCISSNEKDNEVDETKQPDSSILEKEEEIQIIGEFQTELEKKLEDLQQTISNPKSMLSEYLKMVSAAKSASDGKDTNTVVEANASSASSAEAAMIKNCFGSPALSNAASNGGVTHLGVVGRGVKRASVLPLAPEPTKKPATDPSEISTGSPSPNQANTEGVMK